MSAWTLLAPLALALSLPFWLPRAVVALRVRVFALVNGPEGIPVPGKSIDIAHFRETYAHPAAHGRSRGAALSDLFWYWLSPGAELHQEHLEPGARYQEVAATTRRILALPRRDAEALTRRAAVRVLTEQVTTDATHVRLRDLMMLIWAEAYHEIVFREPCPRQARRLIVDNANDVVSALKCCSLRHMQKRGRLTDYLALRLKAGEVPQALPACFDLREQALYLQGVFFNTAIVQASEAMTHLLLLIAQHPEVQARLAPAGAEPSYLDRVITEALRLYPLFGIAHRITRGELAIDGQAAIPSGAVLCFNYAAFHQHGFEEPSRFDPERWTELSARDANYIPFGVAQNRPCPAQAISLISMRVVAHELLSRFELHSSASHTRSIPHRGPCLLVTRGAPRARWRIALALAWMRVVDLWENVGLSLVQLVLGTIMVIHARRLRLCQRYFETVDANAAAEAARLQVACEHQDSHERRSHQTPPSEDPEPALGEPRDHPLHR